MASSRFIAVPSLLSYFRRRLLLLACGRLLELGWIATAPRKCLRRGFILTGIVLLSHTFGLFGRMYIEGRPPVTNLYSSLVHRLGGSSLLCHGKYLRLGVASAMGSFIGAGTLVVAYNLSLDSSLNPTGTRWK